MRRHVVLPLFLLGSVAIAQVGYYEVPDVPTDLSGNTYLPSQVIENLDGTYRQVLTLPSDTAVDAVHRRGTGNWLLSIAAATDLEGTTFDRRDVFETDGTTYTPFFDGAAAGVPAGSNVDATFLLDSGDLVVSFDVMTTIATATYEPADLVTYSGGAFSLLFDASGAGIPAASNVIAASSQDGLTLLSLDVPTTVGSATFLPGQLISWNGSSLALFDDQAAWPANRSSQVFGLSALASPGGVPPTIRVNRVSPTQLTISWSVSDCGGGLDYGVYEGVLGTWTSHQRIDCSDDGGDLVEDIVSASGDRYYLVVPHNSVNEGSYGTHSDLNERSVGSATCAPIQILGCNP